VTRPPNILWIVTTQWRAQACGYSGDPNARTPRLDALAAASVNFTQAVTPHPFGPFARAALLTGVPSPENGVRDYFHPLPAGTRTLAHDLTERSYSTAFFGKWHLAKRDPAAPLVGEAHARAVVPPEARGGFGFWEGFESGFLLNDPWLHGTRLPEPARFEGYQSDILGARAADWIRQSPAGPPWFCLVSLEAPHPPYDAPAPGATRPDPRDIILPANVPRGGEIEAKARAELSGYYAHVAATDRAVGRLIDAAPEEETLAVFTSAHGDMHGAHGLFRKGWPYEESVRVPLLMRGPGRERKKVPARWTPGADDAAVSLVDLPRMMLAAAAGQAWENKNSFAAISMPSVVRQPWQCDRIWRGARTRSRKLALNADGTPWLFFDLETDPGEMQNLAADPTRAAEIRELSQRL
jgi:arylsulfatase A-like enzyme